MTVVAAMRLVRGEQHPPPLDNAAESARLSDEMNCIDRAIRQCDAELDELRADRSAAIARSLLEQHHRILQSKFRAAMALCQASTAERTLIVAMIRLATRCSRAFYSPEAGSSRCAR